MIRRMHASSLLERAVGRAPALLALASAALLATALTFQYGFGYAPCELCLWQRWPYAIALGLMLPPLIFGRRAVVPTLAVGVLLFAANAGIAGFHAGVEQGWWGGLGGCSAPMLSDDPAEALKQIQSAPLVRCDEVAWSLFGLSMAAWNGLAALALTGFAGYALARNRRSPHG